MMKYLLFWGTVCLSSCSLIVEKDELCSVDIQEDEMSISCSDLDSVESETIDPTLIEARQDI